MQPARVARSEIEGLLEPTCHEGGEGREGIARNGNMGTPTDGQNTGARFRTGRDEAAGENGTARGATQGCQASPLGDLPFRLIQ